MCCVEKPKIAPASAVLALGGGVIALSSLNYKRLPLDKLFKRLLPTMEYALERLNDKPCDGMNRNIEKG